MDILALHIRLTEEDLDEALQRHLPPHLPVEDLHLSLPGQGIVLTGMLPLFINVKFETTWDLSVVSGLLQARLSRFKAMGIPANIFKSAVMKIFEDAAKNEPWLKVAGEVVTIDPEGLAGSCGLKLEMSLRAVHCKMGEFAIEAGTQ